MLPQGQNHHMGVLVVLIKRFAFSIHTISEEIQLRLVSQAGFRKREERQC